MKFTREDNNTILANTRRYISRSSKDMALQATLAQLKKLTMIKSYEDTAIVNNCIKYLRREVKHLVG